MLPAAESSFLNHIVIETSDGQKMVAGSVKSEPGVLSGQSPLVDQSRYIWECSIGLFASASRNHDCRTIADPATMIPATKSKVLNTTTRYLALCHRTSGIYHFKVAITQSMIWRYLNVTDR